MYLISAQQSARPVHISRTDGPAKNSSVKITVPYSGHKNPLGTFAGPPMGFFFIPYGGILVKEFPKLYSPVDAGLLIHVAPATLAVWRSTGRYNLKYTSIGRRIFYKETDLLEFLNSRTHTHTGEAEE